MYSKILPCIVKNPTFKVGDRVARGGAHGAIIGVYAKQSKRFGHYPELYAVEWDKWDTVKNSAGFLPHGLHKEEAANVPN